MAHAGGSSARCSKNRKTTNVKRGIRARTQPPPPKVSVCSPVQMARRGRVGPARNMNRRSSVRMVCNAILRHNGGPRQPKARRTMGYNNAPMSSGARKERMMSWGSSSHGQSQREYQLYSQVWPVPVRAHHQTSTYPGLASSRPFGMRLCEGPTRGKRRTNVTLNAKRGFSLSVQARSCLGTPRVRSLGQLVLCRTSPTCIRPVAPHRILV